MVDDAPGKRANAIRCFSAAGVQASGEATGLARDLDTRILAAHLSSQGHLGLCADVPELESPGRTGSGGSARLACGTAARVGGPACAAHRCVPAFHVDYDGEDAR